MTIIYNRNAPDYYLVAGVGEENTNDRSSGYKTRKLSGDYVVISSDQKVNNFLPGSNKKWNALKKTFLFLTLIAAIPFSSTLAAGYIRLLVNGDMS